MRLIMLELFVYCLTVGLGTITVVIFAMLVMGELAIGLGAHVPGHRKMGQAFVWTTCATIVSLIVLIFIPVQ